MRKALIATTIDTKNDDNENNESIATNGQNVSTLIAATRDEDNLLATAMVRVLAKNGEKILVRAVINVGAQSAMVNEHTRQSLGWNGERIYAGVNGVGAIPSTVNKCVELKIFPRFSDDFVLTTKALVMKKITSLNVFKDDLAQYEHLQNIKYADPTISSDHPIEILLNVADYARIVKSGLIKGTSDEPVAQNTEFGYIIFGPDGAKNQKRYETESKISVTTLISNVEIN